MKRYNPRKRIFVDMDGVLAAFNPNATEDQLYEPGYFRTRPAEEEMLGVIRKLIEDRENEVFILSCVPPSIFERAKAEKDAWLDEHLPEVKQWARIFIPCGKDKVDAVKLKDSLCRYDVLLDDHSPNCRAWQEHNGTAIKILNGINGNGGSYTGSRAKPDEVIVLLKAILSYDKN